jgi:hypothetical protein
MTERITTPYCNRVAARNKRFGDASSSTLLALTGKAFSLSVRVVRIEAAKPYLMPDSTDQVQRITGRRSFVIALIICRSARAG